MRSKLETVDWSQTKLTIHDKIEVHLAAKTLAARRKLSRL
jgi:hypothetical protein